MEEHIVLAVEENHGQIQECQLAGKPSLDYSSMLGAAALSTRFQLKAASTQTFLIVTETLGQLQHTLPWSPTVLCHTPGLPFPRKAVDKATAIWGIPVDPEGCWGNQHHLLPNPLSLQPRAFMSNTSTAFSSPWYSQFAGRGGLEGCLRTQSDFQTKEKFPRKRARDS